jgi:hypothetical protein
MGLIQFSDKQPPTITSVLAELGFHMEQCPAGVAAPVRHDPEGAGGVRPSQALPQLLRG